MSNDLVRWMPETSLSGIPNAGLSRRTRNPVPAIRAMGDAHNISSVIAAQSSIAETWLSRRPAGERYMNATFKGSIGGLFDGRQFSAQITIQTG